MTHTINDREDIITVNAWAAVFIPRTKETNMDNSEIILILLTFLEITANFDKAHLRHTRQATCEVFETYRGNRGRWLST